MKNSMKKLRIRRVLVCGMLVALQSCSTARTLTIPEALKISKPPATQELLEIAKERAGARRDHLESATGPTIPTGREGADSILSSAAPKLTGEPISVNFEGVRLPAFINTVLGELLKVSFEIDNAIAQKDQMVTLRTAGSLKPDDFFALVTATLSNYGISVVYANNIYRVVDASNVKKPIPRIIRRTASSVSPDLRPLFYFQPLNSVPTQAMTLWLNLTMGDRVQLMPLPSANGIVILGSNDDVQSAIEIIQTLDQPYLAGSRSLKISPAFWSAQKLSQQLTEILTAEGYSIGIGGANAFGIKLIPVEALNVIIAFGTGEEGLQHLLEWSTQLDQPGQTVSTQGVYYQPVYNAKAKDLADALSGLLGPSGALGGTSGTNDQQRSQVSPAAAGSPAAQSNSFAATMKQRIMVDEGRNALIFVGTAEEYAQFRTLVLQMDRAPLQVMIEATIAEVNLKHGENLGIVFKFDDKATGTINRTAVSEGGAGIFLSLVRDHGTLISQINALADINRLQVLSSPRLVTSSGKAASISVGTQVPIITTQESGAGQVQGSTSILQSIQYRNTGVILNVTPTINSNRRVELTVTQEVSDAQQNNVSGVQSPIIIQRSLQTTLSLDDGETVLLGGMISENFSKGDSGIPYLKDIPILGNLFKSQSQSSQRTELIMLLTPYIIDGPDTARQIRDSFRSKLGEWAAPPPSSAPQATPVPVPSSP